MAQQQHTSEPWELEPWLGTGSSFMLVKRAADPSEGWKTLATTINNGLGDEVERANAQRILDCVNGLAGKKVEHLEPVFDTIVQLIGHYLELDDDDRLMFRERHLGIQQSLQALVGHWIDLTYQPERETNIRSFKPRRVKGGV